jgi:hypothetical protein
MKRLYNRSCLFGLIEYSKNIVYSLYNDQMIIYVEQQQSTCRHVDPLLTN